MHAAPVPPNPYLDRRSYHPAPVHDHERHARIVVAAALFLLGLLALATLGSAVWFLPDWIEQQKIEARMGPKANLAPLALTRLEMGGVGGLSMDLVLQVELEPKTKPNVMEPYMDRIADRLGDRLRDVGLERLNGSEGAKLVKEIARSVVQQELKKVKVRDVLIESMVVHPPYSFAPIPHHLEII